MRTVFSKWWNHAAATTAVLGIAIVGAVSASSQDEQHDPGSQRRKLLEGPEQTLSVDETLGVVFDPRYGVSPRKFYARANPEAKDALYRILENRDLKEFHQKAWEILGYIGGEAHVRRVEEQIVEFKSIPRMLTHTEDDMLPALFNSLGVMCGRKIGRACEAAEKLMQPMYWRDAQFLWHVNQESRRLSLEYQTIRHVMRGYALSLDPEIEKHIQSMLQKVDDPEERESVRKAFSPERLLRVGWNTRAPEEEPVTGQERREKASFFNGNLKNPGPARPPRDIAPAPPDQREGQGLPPPESRREQLKRIAREVSYNADGYIEYLTLRGEDVTNETLALLREAPQLRYLTLRGVAVNDKGLEELPRHAPQLHALSLTDTEITDEGLKHLQGLKELKELALWQSKKISYQGMAHVGRLNGLIELQLWRLPNLTNQGFEDLRSLQKLQALDLNELPITDAVLEHVAALGNLEKLYIRSCPIENRGLAHLRQIAHSLKRLRLQGLPLTDHALVYLQDLKRLEELVVRDLGGDGYTMHVSEEAVRKLQEALPETKTKIRRFTTERPGEF